MDSGEDTIVCVNKYTLANEAPVDVLNIDNTNVRKKQIAPIQETKAKRDPNKVALCLQKIDESAATRARARIP